MTPIPPPATRPQEQHALLHHLLPVHHTRSVTMSHLLHRIGHRRYQYGAALGALVLGAVGVACAVHQLNLHAASFGLGMLVLTEAALREQRRHRRAALEAGWARARALGHNPPPLEPCCLLARSSRGTAHDRKCTDTRAWSASAADRSGV